MSILRWCRPLWMPGIQCGDAPPWPRCGRRKLLFLRFRNRYGRSKKLSETATLSSKFQISLPKRVREEQQWQAGQEFVFIPKGKGVLLMPVPTMRDLAELAQGAKPDGFRDRQDRF
jgi:AbrB family looped-hinge helix DNA binding protein